LSIFPGYITNPFNDQLPVGLLTVRWSFGVLLWELATIGKNILCWSYCYRFQSSIISMEIKNTEGIIGNISCFRFPLWYPFPLLALVDWYLPLKLGLTNRIG